MYNDSCFLNKLSEKNNSKISLMCLLNDKEYYNNPMMITYEKINKIFFYLNYNNCNNYKNLFQNIYKYIIGIKHRQNLEEIFFSNSFQDEREKIMYFNYFIEDYFSFIKKMEKLNLNLFSLKKIEFFDDRINENVQRIQLRYFLNKIFGKNAWCKLIIINYKELENIDKLNERNKNDFIIKLNSFEKEKTNHKILYINLENFSPFQKNIIYFFENYIKNNKNINTIIINNIGNINYNNESYKTIKDNNKIKLPYIEQIIYDNNIFHENKNDINNKNNEIKEINYFFSSLCDDEKLLSYEGYDNNKNLVYFNACKKITCNELERVFKENKNIISLKLVFENIVIKYERNKSHLSIINIGQKGKDYIYYTPIKYFSKFIENFQDLKELTIDGFELELSQIINKNIISLNINILNEFSLNKMDILNTSNISDFSCLQNLNISGNFWTLYEITNNIQNNKKNNNLKNINFYYRNSNKTTVKKLQKNITLKILPIRKKETYTFEYEIEEEENENYEDYENNEDNEYEEDENDFYDDYDDEKGRIKPNKNTNNNKSEKNVKKQTSKKSYYKK